MHIKNTVSTIAIEHITVVIPVYNEQAYIRQCLEALMRQTLKPDVILIVNNNSTDSTVQIAEEYPQVRIISESAQGICAATKTGIDAAARFGGIVFRCDADSQPEPTWIEEVMQSFKASEDVIAVTGPGVPYDTGRIGKALFSFLYMKPYFFLTGLALGTKPLFGSNFAVRASVWEKVSSKTHLTSHQDIHDDIDISYHLMDQGVIRYCKNLRMPISARPFRSPHKMPGRYMAGFRSVFLHWPEQAPWKRFIK